MRSHFRHGLAIGILTVLMASGAWADRHDRFDEARGLVQHVQEDLQRVMRHGPPRNGRERERIDNARKHLSDLDRNLRRGDFDKDRLDSAIDDVKNVVEHNTLDPRDREALSADLNSLRLMRMDKGR